MSEGFEIKIDPARQATPPTDRGPVFDAQAITMQRRTRFNPLRMLTPETLALALDAYDAGQLRQAVLFWDAMARRDDTIPLVKFLREQSCSSQDWQVLKVAGADPVEAARHAAALEYFYANLTAVDAFDRNQRGGYERLVGQQMSAASYGYAVHHLRWQPQPGVSVEVKDAAPVPALTAEAEFVPLWFFENTTGTLRLLPDGGFGVDGRELDWDGGEWMVTTGPGVMMAAGIAYMFKRLTFQDWTIFNERYAQGKVLGRTRESRESVGGQGMESLVAGFNGDMGAVIFNDDGSITEPISILEPTGNSVDVFEKFVDRQDRKIAALFRGQDLSTQSRGGAGEKPIGASVQGGEADHVEQADIRMIEGAQQHYLDRLVIRFCFGPGVKPLAYRGVPHAEEEDLEALRESAGFLADRGFRVSARRVADRLGITPADEGDEDDVLGAVAKAPVTDASASLAPVSTANAADDPAMGEFLAAARLELGGGLGEDLAPLADALRDVLAQTDAGFDAAYNALTAQLPVMRPEIIAAGGTKAALVPILSAGLVDGLASQKSDAE